MGSKQKPLFDPKRIDALREANERLSRTRTAEAREAYFQAFRDLENTQFNTALAAFSRGDYSSIPMILQFLDEDPYFFGSGYIKENLLRKIDPERLTKTQVVRLRALCIRAVDVCGRREFRRYCNVAAKIADEGMVESLRERWMSEDHRVKERAYRMLIQIAHNGRPGLVQLV